MSTINFNGPIKPMVYVAYQTTKVPGAHPTADDKYVYMLANEALFKFTLSVTTDAGNVPLFRSADLKDPKFDAENTLYICEPTSAAALNAIADASKSKPAVARMLSMKIWLKPFFLEVLKLMTRTSADTFNVARPDPASAKTLDASIALGITQNELKVDHPQDFQREIKEAPCEVTGVSVQPAADTTQPPRVVVFVTMRLKDLPAADRDQVVQILIAADYSKMYKFGKKDRPNAWFTTEPVTKVPATGIEKSLKLWEKNVSHYLWNHTSIDRAKTIHKEIVDLAVASMAKSQLEVVRVIRNAIDARLVTANHWGQDREEQKTEPLQFKLMTLFGGIHQRQYFLASPVALMRGLRTKFGQTVLLGIPAGQAADFDVDQAAQLALAWGVGHCGEHAMVSFSIVRTLMQMNTGNATKFAAVIMTGNSNVDHAFVVGGFRVAKVIRTQFTRKHFEGGDVGTLVDVWDLREELKNNPGAGGFVLDPYLAASVQAQTGTTLLARFNGKERGPNRTDFLSFTAQHPILPFASGDPTNPANTNIPIVPNLRGL